MAEENGSRFKKRNIVLYVLMAAIGAVAFYFGMQVRKLTSALNESDKARTQLEDRQTGYQEWTKIDSSLIDGDYQAALRAYNEELKQESGNDSVRLALRIAMARQMSRYRAAYNEARAKDTLSAADSLANLRSATPQEVRDYDEVNFKLEKARTQLARMRRRLREKSFGEYLKFKSSKDHLLHYVGEVDGGKANGYGVAIFDTGSRYEGEWKDNLRHGEGIFHWPDGEYYEGAYVGDERKGQGTYYWPNGEKYSGEWEADKRNGEGIFYDEKGKVMTKGVWKDDKLVEETKKK